MHVYIYVNVVNVNQYNTTYIPLLLCILKQKNNNIKLINTSLFLLIDIILKYIIGKRLDTTIYIYKNN